MLTSSGGLTAAFLSSACGGSLLYEGKRSVTSAVIDSRKVTEGALFVAIAGERTDGHRYVSVAAEQGAAAVLIERRDVPLDTLIAHDCSVILCDNTVLAFGKIAAAYKALCPAMTIAVTGSVGKTTTRQFIYAVLSSALATHKTDGNLNNELGVPLTLSALSPSHRAAVLELGMSAKGEISYLTNIVRPDIAVITNIGTAHIEYLGSREGIRDAKMEIAEGLKPEGTLILNGDEPLLAGIPNAVYVSLDCETADYRAINLRYTAEGMYFDALCPDAIFSDLLIPTLGEHTVLDAMYAVAVGRVVGLSEADIRRGLSAFEGVGMRQNIRIADECLYVLDYYNASAESIEASLTVTKRLSEQQQGRTIAILGSVLELGEHSERLHRRIGAFAATCGIDRLYTFGEAASHIADEAIRQGLSAECVSVFPDISDAKPLADAVLADRRPHDCYLLKASHSIRMERVADLLLSEQSDH